MSNMGQECSPPDVLLLLALPEMTRYAARITMQNQDRRADYARVCKYMYMR